VCEFEYKTHPTTSVVFMFERKDHQLVFYCENASLFVWDIHKEENRPTRLHANCSYSLIRLNAFRCSDEDGQLLCFFVGHSLHVKMEVLQFSCPKGIEEMEFHASYMKSKKIVVPHPKDSGGPYKSLRWLEADSGEFERELRFPPDEGGFFRHQLADGGILTSCKGRRRFRVWQPVPDEEDL
jgi:hypothetical protein